MESLTLIIVVVIGLAVLWPMIVPARNSAVLKIEGLEKEAIISEQKAELKRAQKRSKILEELNNLETVVTDKDLSKAFAGKLNSQADKTAK